MFAPNYCTAYMVEHNNIGFHLPMHRSAIGEQFKNKTSEVVALLTPFKVAALIHRHHLPTLKWPEKDTNGETPSDKGLAREGAGRQSINRSNHTRLMQYLDVF